MQLLLGLLLSSLIAYGGYRKQSLSPSGVGGAIVVGAIIFGLGGLTWGLLLVAFFVSSSFLSHYREREKRALAEKFAKGGQRDLGQVLANGGWGALLAVAYAFDSPAKPFLLAAFVGAMATVNADTWGTEVGVLSPSLPCLITTGRKVPIGTSGGVSPLGTLASLLGALFIGTLALVLAAIEGYLGRGGFDLSLLWLPLTASLGGLMGSLLDSVLGATVQGIYYCAKCDKETESPLHRCGQPAQQIRGWRWLDNDAVNFISAVVGSLIAGGLSYFI